MSRPMIRDLGERELVARVRERLGEAGADVLVGPGDDAAVLAAQQRPTTWTIDRQREGVHFERAWVPARAVGYRAVAAAASDVWSMGARPRWVLCSFELPGTTPVADLDALVTGVAEAAAAAGAHVIGGDLGRGEQGIAVVTTVGGTHAAAARPLLRSTAAAGQELWVVGHVGRAGLGRYLLTHGDERAGGLPDACRAAFLRPHSPGEFACWAASGGPVTAMMDVSDGLAIDLHRLCEASAVGARVEEAALGAPEFHALATSLDLDPVEAFVGGGEDYALLCAVQRGAGDAVQGAAGPFPALRLGELTARDTGVCVGSDGAWRPLAAHGWDPFLEGDE